jgi:deoxyribodipyrimidine photolyase-related protein
MSNDIFIIFPNQLYADYNHLKNYTNVFLIEEPIYFYDPIYKPFRPNKIKIAYMRACMKYYYNTLSKNNINISYITYEEALKSYSFIGKTKSNIITFFDPIDYDLSKKLNKILSEFRLNIIDSPQLLLSKDILKEYYDKHAKSARHASFYEFAKKKLGILENTKNLDKYNRNPPPKKEPNAYHYKNNTNIDKYYNEAITYTEKYFKDHYGNSNNVKSYPITSADSYKQLNRFLTNSLKDFGQYQDAIMEKDVFMYHSVISPMFNIGLITSKDIVNKTIEYYDKNKKDIPIASLEGYIRQIVGWNLFESSLYIFRYNDIIKSNLPNNKNKFKDISIWYKGETGILPFDNEVKKAMNYGYSHHIVRLMIFLNLFILCEVHPDEIYRWFMEVVSIDAYSYLMIPIIYTMGFFYPKAMTKPYLSTSNYIVKMSNYKKDGKWDKIWDALYHDFVSKKPNEYTFFYKRTISRDKNTNKEYSHIAKEFKDKFFK